MSKHFQIATGRLFILGVQTGRGRTNTPISKHHESWVLYLPDNLKGVRTFSWPYTEMYIVKTWFQPWLRCGWKNSLHLMLRSQIAAALLVNVGQSDAAAPGVVKMEAFHRSSDLNPWGKRLTGERLVDVKASGVEGTARVQWYGEMKHGLGRLLLSFLIFYAYLKDSKSMYSILLAKNIEILWIDILTTSNQCFPTTLEMFEFPLPRMTALGPTPQRPEEKYGGRFQVTTRSTEAHSKGCSKLMVKVSNWFTLWLWLT